MSRSSSQKAMIWSRSAMRSIYDVRMADAKASVEVDAGRDSFIESLMDTDLYSMGAFFCDEHPELVDELVSRSTAIEKAGRNRITVSGLEQSQQVFGGVEQQGDRLGAPGAPVAIQLFTDMQCSNCRSQFLSTVPSLVQGDVRDGKLRLE